MKSLFLNNSLEFLKRYKDYSDEEIDMLLYGLEGLYLTITKLIVILLVSILLGILKQVIIILFLFNIIRYFGFGVHAGKSRDCLISSLSLFVLLPYILLKVGISKNIILLLGIIDIIIYSIFAPADTVKRPFFNKKKRIIRKIMTILIGLLYLVISLIIDNRDLSVMICIAMMIQSIVVCPISYGLLGQPYNNYKREKREEV